MRVYLVLLWFGLGVGLGAMVATDAAERAARPPIGSEAYWAQCPVHDCGE